ncbi:regulator of sigma E protease [Ectothiorhodospira mobilis]|uniref:Zinc metalloprotease n=1 Tax=Ectothiorhodospira mobilis TaxID=195064 RepID=A0A1I4RR73_ECTMO|nr:RIP metalloprotease RseP [Ectothiorhodospira mobilis]SFM54686.1 regulator of sigma E protease [Ectothiorhodospira mobilis]
MSFLVSIAAFVVAIGILVTVHEFGHYWVARRCGVKVLRFSVGFGRPLWRRVAGRDGIEYVLGSIPLGGYVKMLDEREAPVPEAERHRAFNRQTVGRRIAIVAAGPAANFLFAIAVFALMYSLGVSGVKPVVGAVEPGTVAAAADVAPRDELLAVGDTRVRTWEQAAVALLDEGMDGGSLALRVRTSGGGEAVRLLDLDGRRHLLTGEGTVLDKLGIRPWRPWSEPVLGELVADGAAARAGLRPGDRILQVDGRPLQDWNDWVAYVQARPDQDLQLRIRRDGRELDLTLHTDAVRENGETVGRIGAYPRVDEAAAEAMRVVIRHDPFTAVWMGLDRTWEMSALTLRVMARLITGDAALSNIAGPVSIAEYAGTSALIGVSAFLSFLGLVSLSLGIINLMPIPVLDGGHLLYYAVELVKGSPVSETVEAVGQRIGLALIAMLMTLALYNDFMRILG